MNKAKGKKEVESFAFKDFDEYKRSKWFEEAKTIIQISLMWFFAGALCVLAVLVFVAGVWPWIFPGSEGVVALQHLFNEIVGNAKTVALVALGFFFREYMNTRNNSQV